MKYLLVILLAFSSVVNACGNDEYEIEPFAEFLEKDKHQKLNVYKIVVPQKKDKYLLTSLLVDIPTVMSARLEFEEWSDNKDYYTSFLWLEESLEKELLVKLKYSTTKDGGMLLCGEYVNHKFTDLLKVGLENTSLAK